MPANLDHFKQTLSRRVGSPDDVRASLGDAVPARWQKANAHVHLPPNFSAFDTPDQALDMAQAEGVRALGASNYYDYEVYVDFAEEAGTRGIFPMFGLEIITLDDDLLRRGIKVNDPGNSGKYYICGKGITRFAPLDPGAAALLQTIRDNDGARMATIAGRLTAIFADAGVPTGLDADTIKQRVAARHVCPIERVYLQERHLAQAFQELSFEKTESAKRPELFERVFGTASKDPDSPVVVQNEIRSHLMKAGKAAFVPDTFVDFDHAYRLILALGGIPCYPTLADGASPICGYEADVDALIADLKSRNIHSAELIPFRNSPEALRLYALAMRSAGIFVTAGTEHNTLDRIAIAPAGPNNTPIADDLQEIFYEGACVVAAHEFLTLHGEPGFVDNDGVPNGAYATAEARIGAFRAIGASVIDRFAGVGQTK